MDILNTLFYWTGVGCWALTLFFAFLWSIGTVGIEKMTREEYEESLKNDAAK